MAIQKPKPSALAFPAAARVGDDHLCKHTTNGAPHRGGEIVEPGAATVLVGGQPAARVGDRCDCEGGAFDVIVQGEPTVLIGGKAAARRGDATDGGEILEGDETVQIGPRRRLRGRDRSRAGRRAGR